MKVKMYKINLELALHTAINSQSTYEREHYDENYESSLVRGWKQALEELEKPESTGIECDE